MMLEIVNRAVSFHLNFGNSSFLLTAYKESAGIENLHIVCYVRTSGHKTLLFWSQLMHV